MYIKIKIEARINNNIRRYLLVEKDARPPADLTILEIQSTSGFDNARDTAVGRCKRANRRGNKYTSKIMRVLYNTNEI